MKKMVKLENSNSYIVLTIVILIIISIILFIYSVNKQKFDYLRTIENVTIKLEQITTNEIDTLKILKQSFVDLYDLKDKITIKYANKLHHIDNKGNFALDIDNLINITGFGGISSDIDVQREIELSIMMTNKFKTVKKFNDSYTWLYYSSKNHFTANWPFLHSSKFGWKLSDENNPLFQYAIPKNNPKREIFFTPLYFDAAGLGLMVTIGNPIYIKDEFLGTINVDITLDLRNGFFKNNNLKDITMIIINKDNQIIGANDLKGFDNSKIYHIDKFIPSDILDKINKNNNFNLIDSNYYYIKNYKNAPWRIIAFTKQSDIVLNALLLTIPILLLILLLIKIISFNNKISNMAYHDSLTGLANRYYLYEFEKKIISTAKRLNLPVSLAIIDIDKFKLINDKYGHSIGDKVLIDLSNIIFDNIRISDLFVRYGGEEFIILFTNTNLSNSIKLSNKLLKTIENSNILDDEIITVSIGLSVLDINNETVDDAIKKADLKLYEAKNTGRNKVVF